MQKQRDPLYFISILPPAEIRREVEIFKKHLRDEFDIKHSLKLPAHITIQIPFRMAPEKEPILFKKLAETSQATNSFPVRLNGFEKFAKNVIFIKVEGHESIIQLHKKIELKILSFMELKPHERPARIHPHVTIATRDLKRSHFPGVWEEFKDKEYQALFVANSFHLLKHNGKTWELFRKFEFQN